MTAPKPPVTLETLNAFLESAAWWEHCRKDLHRFAYRAVRQLAEVKAAERLNGAARGKSWAEREETRK